MESKARFYLPQAFKVFQGFDVVDLKEWRSDLHLEVILAKNETREHFCWRCGTQLGAKHDEYRVKAKHLRMMGWQVSVVFWREKRHCPGCKKVRSEKIEFLCPSSPHLTMDLAWWLNRLSEITSVLAVSKLERIDKEACYQVDKHILTRLLQGYEIPKVTHISVDEVYARSRRQLKEDEDRDDLFLTVIVDLKTHKVIWVSQSRKKRALDEFFELIGKKACAAVTVVAADQHEGYSASVREHCPHATIVFDRFHLVQKFNDLLNDERRSEFEGLAHGPPEVADEIGDLMRGKYKYVFLTKAKNRSKTDQRHINEVMKWNERIAKLEIVKEHFHKLFDCNTLPEAQTMLEQCWEWSRQCHARGLTTWFEYLMDEDRFWNYFRFKVTTAVSEGVNRVIKGLKWQAYGYKDMFYFALKILQKAGYLNSCYHFQKIPTPL